jgi:hypothetical protein
MSEIDLKEKSQNDVRSDLSDFWVKSRSSQERFQEKPGNVARNGQDAAGFVPGTFWSVSRRNPDDVQESSQKRARTRGKRAGSVPGTAGSDLEQLPGNERKTGRKRAKTASETQRSVLAANFRTRAGSGVNRVYNEQDVQADGRAATMKREQAVQDKALAYMQAHPDQSDGQVAEALSVSRPTIVRWRRAAGIPPRYGKLAGKNGSDEPTTAPIPAAPAPDRIPTWNETIITLLRYTDDRRYPDYALDLQAEADEVEQPVARATSIRRMMDRLDAYCTILDPEKRGRR